MKTKEQGPDYEMIHRLSCYNGRRLHSPFTAERSLREEGWVVMTSLALIPSFDHPLQSILDAVAKNSEIMTLHKTRAEARRAQAGCFRAYVDYLLEMGFIKELTMTH